MTAYIALLRGINVGGNNIIKMEALRTALTADGFQSVSTYIQSGNVLFVSDNPNARELAEQIEMCIVSEFSVTVPAVVFSREQWTSIIAAAPLWWGSDARWKHNLIALLPPLEAKSVGTAVGQLKPDIETMLAGENVVYQSLSIEHFGKTTSGKLASNPIYKHMTIRAYSTSHKLLERLNTMDDDIVTDA